MFKLPNNTSKENITIQYNAAMAHKQEEEHWTLK